MGAAGPGYSGRKAGSGPGGAGRPGAGPEALAEVPGVITEGQSAEGAQAGGGRVPRNAVDELRVEPAFDRRAAFVPFEVVAWAVQTGQEHVSGVEFATGVSGPDPRTGEQ